VEENEHIARRPPHRAKHEQRLPRLIERRRVPLHGTLDGGVAHQLSKMVIAVQVDGATRAHLDRADVKPLRLRDLLPLGTLPGLSRPLTLLDQEKSQARSEEQQDTSEYPETHGLGLLARSA
jgi:hypothetical protein